MKKLLLILLCLPIIGFGQSKKKQIASLNLQVDSLNYILDIQSRDFNHMKEVLVNNIDKLNSKVDSFQLIEKQKNDVLNKSNNKVDSLNSIIDNLEYLVDIFLIRSELNLQFYGEWKSIYTEHILYLNFLYGFEDDSYVLKSADRVLNGTFYKDDKFLPIYPNGEGPFGMDDYIAPEIESYILMFQLEGDTLILTKPKTLTNTVEKYFFKKISSKQTEYYSHKIDLH